MPRVGLGFCASPLVRLGKTLDPLQGLIFKYSHLCLPGVGDVMLLSYLLSQISNHNRTNSGSRASGRSQGRRSGLGRNGRNLYFGKGNDAGRAWNSNVAFQGWRAVEGKGPEGPGWWQVGCELGEPWSQGGHPCPGDSGNRREGIVPLCLTAGLGTVWGVSI